MLFLDRRLTDGNELQGERDRVFLGEAGVDEDADDEGDDEVHGEVGQDEAVVEEAAVDDRPVPRPHAVQEVRPGRERENGFLMLCCNQSTNSSATRRKKARSRTRVRSGRRPRRLRSRSWRER